jgi:hypothetical protein
MVSAEAVTCRMVGPARHKQKDARDRFVFRPYSDGLLALQEDLEEIWP